MKSSKEIIGLKIISINEGKNISKVKDIIINGHDGSLAFFVIDQPSDYFGARLIAFADIHGLGDYALIINESSVIQDVAHNTLAVELLQKDIRIIGAQLLTTQGRLIGEIDEIVIDEATGKISTLEVTNLRGESSQYNCDTVITYGREIILMDDTQPTISSGEPGKVEPGKIEYGNILENTTEKNPEKTEEQANTVLSEKEILKKRIEQFGKTDTMSKPAVNEMEAIVYPEDFNVFEQRQLQFLFGKTIINDVQLDNGRILKAGEQVTAEFLSEVKTRSALMQMTAQVMK